MNGSDPIRSLQAAARAVAEYVSPGHPARRVIVLAEDGAKLLDTTVPVCPCPPETRPEQVTMGWVVTERSATFDGQPVPVAPSRLKLLKALVEADGPITAKELTARVFDKDTDDANTRYHIRELKKELNKAFTFDGDVLQGDADGYKIVLR